MKILKFIKEKPIVSGLILSFMWVVLTFVLTGFDVLGVDDARLFSMGGIIAIAGISFGYSYYRNKMGMVN